MIAVLAYAGLAVLIILLVAVLVRQNRPADSTDEESEPTYVQNVWDAPWLNLAKQIFDSADYLWLRDELRFPPLARALFRSRRRMALRWLKALGASFNELVSTPDPSLAEDYPDGPPGSWRLLWLTLRFHFLLNYALLVVWLVGPYHRLIPAFNWRRFIPAPSPRAERVRSAGSNNA